jgi:hypothetical protein
MKRYLAVDDTVYAQYQDESKSTIDSRFYNCFLVNGEDPHNWNVLKDHGLTKNSLIFRVIPTGLCYVYTYIDK